MARSTLKEAIDFLKQIDIWHEFKFSEKQLMTVAPELQQYGQSILSTVLNLVKTIDRKPSPAKIMNLCREQMLLLKQENQLESGFEESPDTWMTSTEYAKTQGFPSLKALIQSKINNNHIETGSSALSSASSSIVDAIDLGEEE